MPGRISPGMTAKERKARQSAIDNKKAQLAEDMYEKLINQGKVTPANIQKIKERIARKTGAWPLGGTN